MIVDNSNVRNIRRRTPKFRGLGLYDPSYLYSAPAGLVTYETTPFVTQVDSQGNTYTSGGNVIYPGGPIINPQSQPQVTSVYDVPGLLLPYSNCLDSMGGSAGSGTEACVNRNLEIQQENFRRTAAYNAGTLVLPLSLAISTPTRIPTTSTPISSGQVEQTREMEEIDDSILSSDNMFVILDKITEDVSIGGFDIPIWAIGLLAIGGVVFVASKSGGS